MLASQMSTRRAIKPKDRDGLIQSLRAGVAPRTGLQHIQVGRVDEIKAVVSDLDRIADGGSGFRFIIGEYGSGKTFFLHLIKSIALERGLVACQADLDPDRRLHATGGQARSLFAELMRSMSTRTKPQGGALPNVVERFITSALQEASASGKSPVLIIRERLGVLQEMVGGYDFAEVLAAYWRAYDSGDEGLKSDAVRWLRGEFSTRTDARAALGVRTIVDDASVYDHLKLIARFVRLSGYKGLVICLDEMVNIFKLTSTQARKANYEQILRMFNDSLQGESVGLGFLMGGTPDFLMDPRRGLYSYEALQSRLARNTFLQEGMVDWTGPVLCLANLQPEDLYVLLHRLCIVYARGNGEDVLLPNEGIEAFLHHCRNIIGDAYFRTPRNSIKAFLDLLATIEQNPGADWRQLLRSVSVERDNDPQSSDDELAAFTL